jgi:multiple sugar transport system permease protein
VSSDQVVAPGQAQFSSSRRQVRLFRRLEPYNLLLPTFVVLSLFFFAPAVYNILLSFQEISLFELNRGGKWVGLQNFLTLASDSQMAFVLGNTVIWLTLVTVLLRLGLGLCLAVLLNADVLRRWRLTAITRSLLLIPWLVPPVLAVGVWQWMMHPRYGVINLVLLEFHLIDEGIPFLARASTVWWAIVAIVVWRELPFVVISLLAGLQSIPEELREAARIDGASETGVFRHVTLPLLRPVLVIVALLTTIWTFNNFVYVWLTTRGGPGNFTQVLSTQMYTEAFTNYKLGLGAAIGAVMSIIMTIFAVIYFFTVFRKSMVQT